MRGERVRRAGRDDQQIAGASGDDVVVDQQVERSVENVEQLRGVVVPVRHGAVRVATERDAMALKAPAVALLSGQQHVPDEVEGSASSARTSTGGYRRVSVEDMVQALL